MSKKIKVSTPARICLFGEHQDYLDLPVIASAINMRMSIEGHKASNDSFFLQLPDIGSCFSVNPEEEIGYTKDRDYLPAAVNVLKRRGMGFLQGFSGELKSQIPINSGLASSSALVVSWLRFLLETQVPDDLSVPHVTYTLEQLAELAYETEVAEFREGGGKMDHYTLALGGTLYIDTRSPVRTERLNFPQIPSTPSEKGEFVLGNSLEKKDTIEYLKRMKKEISKTLKTLEQNGFNRYTTPLNEVSFNELDSYTAERLRATLINRDITQSARQLLKKSRLDEEEKRQLGSLLNLHQKQLRNLGLSTRKLDYMIEASLNAGALGAKFTGSGGGGCMFAYCPEKQEEVKEAIEKAGGKAYIVKPDVGVIVHKDKN